MTTTKTVAPAGSYRACIRCRAAGFCIHPQAGQGVYRVQARRLRADDDAAAQQNSKSQENQTNVFTFHFALLSVS